jgi:pyruvate,water dikinase
MTDPDWEPVLARVAAVVTDEGGRTCHAAIVSRELGPPCVVGTGRATATLNDGREVTVSCAEGDVGKVYDGAVEFDRTEIDLAALPTPRVPLMLNLANPEPAYHLAALPSAGVGLVRIEFVVSHWIGVHPMALLHPEPIPDPAAGRAHRILRGAARGRRRPDRGGLPPETRHRTLLRLQDQRVRRAAGRRGLRAVGSQSDDRLPRRLAILRRPLS